MNTSNAMSQASADATSPGGPFAAAMGILLAVGLAYAGSFGGPFLFDDIPTIVQNESIRRLQTLDAVLSPPTASTSAGRPLVQLSLAVNYALCRLNVVGYHAFNFGVHLLAALTLFGVARRSLLLSGSKLAARSTPLAAMIALVWAIHPLQTESVTYVTQRAESMAGLFYLLTLYAAIRGAESQRPRRWHVVSVASCLAGMACKEVMVSAPLIVLLYDRAFLSKSFQEIRARRGGFYLALAATWLLQGWLVYSTGNRGSSAGFGLGVSVGEYAATQLVAIPHYLWLCFWPRWLAFDYGPGVIVAPSRVVPGALVVGLLIAATLAAWRLAPRLGFLGVFFFAVLAPSSSVVPVVTQTMAEHRMYLALAAVATLFVLAGDWLLDKLLDRALGPQERQLRQSIVAVAAGAVILALGARTMLRNHDYRSERAIWLDTARKVPDSGRAHAAAAVALLQAGETSEAIREATRAIELDPEPGAYLNRGNAYLLRGRDAEALADFNRSIELKSDLATTYCHRGGALMHLNRLDEAEADFTRAIELSPEFSTAYLQRGVTRFYRQRYDEAIQDFDRTLELEPRAGDAYYNRAHCRYAQKQYRAAMQDMAVCRDLGFRADPEFIAKLAKAAAEERLDNATDR